MKKQLIIRDYLLIVIGSLLYAIGVVMFIFQNELLLGGTSGISVILTAFLSQSPGTILTIINLSLIVLAFLVLGRSIGIRTAVGSILTTVFVSVLEKPLTFETPLITSPYLAAPIGAAIIAVASGIMFYVDSNSGGTDIIALIVKKFSSLQIGRALFVTDILIVILGGLLSNYTVFFSSILGFLVKVLGVDAVLWGINALSKRKKCDTCQTSSVSPSAPVSR